MTNMKPYTPTPLLVCSLLFLAAIGRASAQLITVALEPAMSQIEVGQSFGAALRISGLGDQTVPSLGAFDLDIRYDPAALRLSDVVFGDPAYGKQLDLLGFGSITQWTPSPGSVNLLEVSLDAEADLVAMQRSDFILATLLFDTLAAGGVDLTIHMNAVADAAGLSLNASLVDARVQIGPSGPISPVPEPATYGVWSLLLALGLVYRRRSLAMRSLGQILRCIGR